MGAVKTEKEEFSYSHKKKKLRVRVADGNEEPNGTTLINGFLIEFPSTLSPAPAAEERPQ